ncbi:hypothetical protein [Natrarchaeobaculum sulfurireducens]|uniref:Uncharacterized protein n=1 Tax=Natrarchaeobaculum sulfurireducens TaxID=2044521 RepID=A0A346PRG0_9EURY|nr:hypothetical protein [Natrarchaeobaculum sulfurireducens]AXR82105.1 hypothetical protein AArcMg_2107 [Natrarchaeobaculum sulfurireducens]
MTDIENWKDDRGHNVWTDELGFTDLGTDKREEIKEEVKDIISNLGETHPDIFEDKEISPADYQRELDTAIHSIDGKIKAERGKASEKVVREVFLDPAKEKGYLDYTDQRGEERIDFKGRILEADEAFSMDVKGGEGQSLAHLLVPSNTDVLTVWSERKSRNTKSPDRRLNEVINRVVRWAINHDQDLSLMIIRDPKAGARTDDNKVIPDVVVFPKQFPSPENPSPEFPDLDDIELLGILYEVMTGNGDVYSEQNQKHIWWHDLEYVNQNGEGRVEKEIYNAYDNSISLITQAIHFDRISDVE